MQKCKEHWQKKNKKKIKIMIDFDLENCPKDEEVEVYYPDGTLLVRTDNDILFLYICSKIKENKVDGFYACMAKEMEEWRSRSMRGEVLQEPHKIPITNYGRARGPFPKGFFHVHAELLRKLI